MVWSSLKPYWLHWLRFPVHLASSNTISHIIVILKWFVMTGCPVLPSDLEIMYLAGTAHLEMFYRFRCTQLFWKQDLTVIHKNVKWHTCTNRHTKKKPAAAVLSGGKNVNRNIILHGFSCGGQKQSSPPLHSGESPQSNSTDTTAVRCTAAKVPNNFELKL